MLICVGCECALPLIRDAKRKSNATKSRRRITISVDDTVIKRCGQLLNYTYSWWSGQYNRTVNGQNLLAITIRIGCLRCTHPDHSESQLCMDEYMANDIGQRVIPLCVRPVAKQGRANTEKPELLKTMLSEVKDFFSKHSIDITQFPITFDSWYGSQPLREVLEELGFCDILVDTKSDYVFTIDGQKAQLRHHKKHITLESAWGCDVNVSRKIGLSPTFSKVTLLFFADGKRKRCMMSFSPLRASQILRIWRQHHGIEEFWRYLKHLLQLSQMSLHGRSGAYAGVAVKLLSYLLGLSLSTELRMTFHQVKVTIRKQVEPEIFFFEHFHLGEGENTPSAVD